MHCSQDLVEWRCLWSHNRQEQAANRLKTAGTQTEQKRENGRKKQLTNPRGSAMSYIILRNIDS
jgi:hypothetical protein